MKKVKKKKNNYILCIILVIIIILALILIKHLNKQPEEVEVKASALRLENTNTYNNELKVYLEKDASEDDYSVCYDEVSMCGKEYLSIKTESDESYLIDNYKYKYFFYTDQDKVKVYDTSDNKSYSIDKLKSDYSLEFIVDEDDKLIGVIYYSDLNERTSYLLIDSNEIIYNGKYDYIVSLTSKYLTASKYDKKGNQVSAYILDATKEAKPLITKDITTEEYYGFFPFGSKYITFEWDKVFEIYDSNTLKIIYKTTKSNKMYADGSPMFLYSIDSKDNIYIYDDKYLSIIDGSGKVIKKSSEEIPGIDIVDKYIINNSNNELTITDIDNKTYKIASLINGNVDYYEYINQSREGIVFEVYDKTLTYKDVYNTCKNTTCKGISLEEFEKDYKNQLGYEYFFDYKTLNITKTKTVIIPTESFDW